ncbi:Na+/H+ antiporter [Niallia circulans]|jgi:monovalent cation/hydrogen antiporter|uniref:Na+/H+ antiporter n=1 Tax=Niallia TaxID=2837506 RepID=UPI00077CA94B|nr:Na+/H+ antiporter [Niallia circulans]MDR4318740.1 Na+/H+ antiporter [Niallia circulans]MED3839995.1 Na+/H+ antiporter [Niallia circulans]MED4245784.1 Na+/H+ antiporter [Niallia circulans]MED4250368.1 Na+/H+ antiporter [Niallia circulans]MED5099278.1 Na+/H+ antiporter [Niallia circulans]
MELLITIILLLFCLLISNIVSHYLPSIPTALTQIAFGVVMALLFSDFELELEAEWFLLLFVAPLLYNDGRHFPREELWKMRTSILGNAIILVLLTTIVGGYFVHWLIPSIPLAAAFALAAILSPTDPVAVNGIAKRIHIPASVLNLVRGESLINDASGLVAFNYAVAAVVTGYFSITEALTDFTYTFFIGAVAGLVLSLLIIIIRFILRKQGIQDVTFHSLLQVLTPFLIFIIAEEMLHASGVIAVVVGGIIHSLVSERTETMLAEEQVLTENIWSIVIFILNGIVFLLLGLNIPSSIVDTVEDPSLSNWLIIGYVMLIGIVILGIRFFWSYLFSIYEYKANKTRESEKPSMKHTLLVSLTGVRGAVTMAGVLSIPFVIHTGQGFPERSLILFLAAGVIMFTLLAATIFLPFLSKNSGETEINDEELVIRAKKKLMLSTIDKLYLEMNEENTAAAYELIDEYKRRIQQLNYQVARTEEEENKYSALVEIRLRALKEERNYVHHLVKEEKISEEVFAIFEKSLDYREEILCTNVQTGTRFLFGKAMRGWKRFVRKHRGNKRDRREQIRISKEVLLNSMKSALSYLEQWKETAEHKQQVESVILEYRRMVDRWEKQPSASFNEKLQEQIEELRLGIVDQQRAAIQQMYEKGEINREQTKELRRFVHYIESVTLYEYEE